MKSLFVLEQNNTATKALSARDALLSTNAIWLGTKRKMKTRKQLMQELNKQLKTDFNWSRLSRLDLERLVNAINDSFWIEIASE